MKFDDEFDKDDREKSFLHWYVFGYFISFLIMITAMAIIILEVTK